MRLRKKTIVGRIGSDGEMSVPWSVLEDFCHGHRDRGIIIRAEILAKEPSEKTRAYFFGYIIPELQGLILTEYGERYSREQTYYWIRSLCPFFYSEERKEGRWLRTLKEFEELDQAEANEAIEWVIQFCAENFYHILDYPSK